MIRHAVAEDLPAIVAIYNAAVPGHMATADLEPVTVEERRTWFDEHGPVRHPLWVDERDGEIVGWLSLSRFYDRAAWDPTAELGVYVAPEQQRRGIATALLRHAIERASALGFTSLLGLVFGHNQPSVALLEGLGFQRWGHLPRVTQIDGVRRDVLIMGVTLA